MMKTKSKVALTRAITVHPRNVHAVYAIHQIIGLRTGPRRIIETEINKNDHLGDSRADEMGIGTEGIRTMVKRQVMHGRKYLLRQENLLSNG